MAENIEKQEKQSGDHFQVEEAFGRLEEIIGRLESDSLPLRESIALYGEGAELLVRCREELTGIEKEMIVISEQMEQGEDKNEI